MSAILCEGHFPQGRDQGGEGQSRIPALWEDAAALVLIAALISERTITIMYPESRISVQACGIATVCERSEEHTSELQSLMRISYAVFCLKKKNNQNQMQSQL